MKQTGIILASGSPRRIEIMQKHGITPAILKPEVEENLPQNIGMEEAVMYLALKKALYAEERCADGLIIAADTVVYLDRIIGKPQDEQDAVEILKFLRGRKHTVATGAALIAAHTDIRRVFCERTDVYFKNYTDEDIAAYVATGEPLDKAGAYAVQGGFAPYISRIEGDYNNVVGFPWTRICDELKRMDLGSTAFRALWEVPEREQHAEPTKNI